MDNEKIIDIAEKIEITADTIGAIVAALLIGVDSSNDRLTENSISYLLMDVQKKADAISNLAVEIELSKKN